MPYYPSEPSLTEAQQLQVDAMRSGTFAVTRVPQVIEEDFHLANWTSHSGTWTVQDGEEGHPGILRGTTGSTINDTARLTYTLGASDTPWKLGDVASMRLVARLSTSTDVRFYAGLYGGSVVDTRFGADSLIGEFDTSVDTQIRAVAKSGGSTSTIATVDPRSGAEWLCFDFIRNSATSFLYFLNGEYQNELAANITTAPVGVGFALETLAAASVYVDTDYARVELYPAQRFA